MLTTGTDRKRIAESLTQARAMAQRTGTNSPWIISIPRPAVDILSWLASAEASEKWYWRDREGGVEIGGTGCGFTIHPTLTGKTLQKINELLASLADRDAFFFSAQWFTNDHPRGTIWSDFPLEIGVIPKNAVVNEDGEYRLTICREVRPDADIDALVSEAERLTDNFSSHVSTLKIEMLPRLVSENSHPSLDQWRDNIQDILRSVGSDQIEKVVLARCKEYRFERPVDAIGLLAHLQRQNRSCYSILFQPAPETAFISVTPERLYRRQDRTISIDALSSTVPRGTNPDDDGRLEQKLLESDKQRREHRIVIDGMLDDIGALCDSSPAAGRTVVMKLDRIQHLYTPIMGNLRHGVSDAEIIEALHPTPATAGRPKAAALEKINRLEAFDRGWYAAPIGLMSRDDADFAVGIRSAVVRKETVSVFSGAGIVSGSDPDGEWREIESKDIIRHLIQGGHQ